MASRGRDHRTRNEEPETAPLHARPGTGPSTNGHKPVGRVPPHNIQAEESLLGAMLLSREAVDTAVETVAASDFYKPAHGQIFSAITNLYGRGEPTDTASVGDELLRAGLLEEIGASTLTSLLAGTPAPRSAPRYARIVADHSLLRRMIGVAGEIAEIGYSLPDDVPVALDQAEAMLYGLADLERRHTDSLVADALGGWLDALEARWGSDELGGVPTGWRDLDEMLLGLHAGQLVACAARPAMGKSAWGLQLAVTVAAAARPVLIVSAEMGQLEILERLVALAGVVDHQHLRAAKLCENDWQRISHAVTTLAGLPLHLVDDPAASLLTIRAAARRAAARSGPLALIVVDYLQLLEAAKRSENRQTEVAELSRGLKKMALEMQIPVVALAQLNRNLELRRDKRPMLADLRESGAVENDSDVVLFIYRDEVYNPKTADRGVVELIVAKQRNGPVGTVRLAFDARYGRFLDLVKGSP